MSYIVQVDVLRANGKTQERGYDNEARTPQDALARALIASEVCHGDKGITIRIAPAVYVRKVPVQSVS